jgi:hypothetical protein
MKDVDDGRVVFLRFEYHTWTLWRSEAIGGFYPELLRNNVYLAPTFGRDTKVS